MGSKFNISKTKVKDNKLGNWVGAATKVSGIFVVTKDNKNKGRGGNIGRISAVEVLVRGHGRKGQDRVRERD